MAVSTAAGSAAAPGKSSDGGIGAYQDSLWGFVVRHFGPAIVHEGQVDVIAVERAIPVPEGLGVLDEVRGRDASPVDRIRLAVELAGCRQGNVVRERLEIGLRGGSAAQVEGQGDRADEDGQSDGEKDEKGSLLVFL